MPGSVRGLARAHGKFGKLPWKDVVMPGVLLAEQGFPMSAGLARSLNRELAGRMADFPVSVAAYGKPGGGEWREGDRMVLADLGKTLRAIATDGPDVFYKGWIADRIADDMKANGGLITRQDLAKYQARERPPLRRPYRGYEIVSMPPVSSGGVALIEMLNILEPYDLKSKGLLTAPALHLQIEAMRRAYLDRARFLGDPDFVKVPVVRLTSKSHAKSAASTIDPARASSSVDLGKDIVTAATAPEPDETTHYSIMDRDGMAVTTTTTLEGGFGSHVVVKGTGFLLNNEMGDFNRKPGDTNLTGGIGTPPNLIDPGKRMLSSMTPTMVLKNGKVVLLTGSPGGRTIINTVLTVVLGVTEYGLTGREAVDLPRMHHQWLPDRASLGVEPEAMSSPTQRGSEGRRRRRAGRAPRDGTHRGRAPKTGRGMRIRSGSLPTGHPTGSTTGERRIRRRRPGSVPSERERARRAAPFDSPDRRAIGLRPCFARSTTTGTIITPAPAGRSCCTRTERTTRQTAATTSPAGPRFSGVFSFVGFSIRTPWITRN